MPMEAPPGQPAPRVEVVTHEFNKIVDQDLYNQAQEVRDAAELVADVVTALHGEEGVARGNPISKNLVIRFSEEPQGERLLKDLSAPPSDAQASRDVDRPTIRPPEYEGVPRDGDLEFPDFLGRMSEQRIADAFPDGEWCFLAADKFPAEVRNQLFNEKFPSPKASHSQSASRISSGMRETPRRESFRGSKMLV